MDRIKSNMLFENVFEILVYKYHNALTNIPDYPVFMARY